MNNPQNSSCKLIDLTHTVHPDIPTWDMTCGYFVKTMRDYRHCEGEFKFRSQALDIRASAGTHMDAPAHCFEGTADISQIPLEDIIAPGVVLNVSSKAHERYKLTVDDVLEFEKHYGTIQPGSFVIVYTGWSKHWDNPRKYHNNLVFPSVSKEAGQLLLERGIVGLGIDTLSPDCDEKGSFVHAILLGNGKYIVENVAHADLLPATNFTVFVLPLKVHGAAESPVRLVGLYNVDTIQKC